MNLVIIPTAAATVVVVVVVSSFAIGFFEISIQRLCRRVARAVVCRLLRCANKLLKLIVDERRFEGVFNIPIGGDVDDDVSGSWLNTDDILIDGGRTLGL